MQRLASIDIGSQTIRLLVAERTDSGTFIPVYRDRSIVRLGEGMNEKNHLMQASIDRALTCISQFVNKARQYNASKIFPVSTACVRKAENRAEFLEKVKETSGVTAEVLTGEKEALLALKGVLSVCNCGCASSLVIDIGGGSTELNHIENNSLASVESIPLGVIGLSEKHLQSDPPLTPEIKSLQQDILNILNSESRILRHLNPGPLLFGTAGTITTLAAMDLKMTEYDPHRINGHVLSHNKIEKLCKEMISLPSWKRCLMPGLEQGRSIVIIPGTVIVLEIMEILSCTKIKVSDAGLLEGVILEKLGFIDS